jgi:hypothetical protein
MNVFENTRKMRPDANSESRAVGKASLGSENARFSDTESEDGPNWGVRLIEHGLYPFALAAAPAFLLALIIYFVARAFTGGLQPGIRSFAAVLLPLMIMTFIAKYRPDSAGKLARIPGFVAFTIMFVVAGAMMQLLTFSTKVPLPELVLSAAFSIIVLGYFQLNRSRVITYCIGTVLGALSYVVLLGFPSL